MFLPSEYAVVANMYAYVSFFLVLLTFGMETAYFRYASKSDTPENVYSTSLISLFFTTASFILVVSVFRNEIAGWINYPEHPEYILWFAIILGIDAFTAIPFARLRLNNRPIKFATVKFLNIGFNIAFNLFFISLCPKLIENNPNSFINSIYSPEIGVGYVFISNLLASIIVLILLLPEIFRIKFVFDGQLLKKMLSYGFPILVVGMAGMVNQNIYGVVIPFLVPEDQGSMQQLGIYATSFRMAVLMNMFIQAFRYAFEPFFFARGGSKDDPKVYADIMKYFVIFGLLIFLGMMLYVDVLKFIIDVEYHEGLKILPLVLMANLFFGMYFTLSLWYKLTDKTRFGAYMALTGAVITVLMNFALVPIIGYMGSAIAIFTCYLVMLIISYVLGQKYYPIPYDLKRIASYFTVALSLFIISKITNEYSPLVKYFLHTTFIALFLFTVYRFEKNELKGLFKFNKKK